MFYLAAFAAAGLLTIGRTSVSAQSLEEQAQQRQQRPIDLGAFWPLNAPQRKWDLISRGDRKSLRPRILMSVANETIDAESFTLWFSQKRGQRPGERDGERYRICKKSSKTWLFLDGYINSGTGKDIEHLVESDRILFTPEGNETIDLVDNGDYRKCGGVGQPYLSWSIERGPYRIQVWGHLKENSKFKWYWDAIVSGPDAILDDCLKPPEQRLAIKVREAWWANFKNPSGQWSLGSGETPANTAVPSGKNVSYGRTVWHGVGQTPYLMTGSAASEPTWCVNHVSGMLQDEGNCTSRVSHCP